MTITFGSFDGICQTAALVICPLVGPDQGIEPTCYSRNVELTGTMIFQPGMSPKSQHTLHKAMKRERWAHAALFQRPFVYT